MDQLSSSRSHAALHTGSRARQMSRRFTIALLVSGALAGALGVGYWAGRFQHSNTPEVLTAKATPTGPVIYYRDPDGRPYYSAEPKRTSDGREYIAVRASEDVRFGDQSPQGAPAQASKRILYYRNPMGLPDTSPVPKKDSMGMDYLPVYEGESEEGNTVKMSPGKLQRTGVRSEKVGRRIVVRSVRVPGTVQVDERRVTVVSTRSDAFIDRVENVTTGDHVRKGQPLLQLYSPDIAAAAAQFVSNPGFEGARRRLENLNVPSDVINEIERTRKVPLSIGWSALRDGIVLERNAVEGMKSAAGEVLFRIADLSVVWIIADVPEHDLGGVKVGQPATMRIRSLPGHTFTGRIGLIYPQVSRATRTTRVRIEVPNPDNILLPDMYADVEVSAGEATPVVAVPDSAIIDSGTRQVVIVDLGDGRFRPQEVKSGSRGDGFVEIREGVGEGDRVVVTANFLIDADSNLKAALKALNGDQPK